MGTPTKRIDAARLKEAIRPDQFYLDELASMPIPRKRAGLVNGGLCPFHADTRPNSFFVNLDTGGFTCYACGAHGGDVIAFAMLRNGYSFRETLEYLVENHA